MALLNSSQPSSVYVDPRASVLYGAGNNNITPAQIKDYITAPGRSEQDILGAALANNVSIDQIQNAMAGSSLPLTSENMSRYAKSQGISQDKQDIPIQYKEIPYTQIQYTPITNVEATQDQVKGTVAGQLNNVLDSNSPVMQRAATFGNQQANSRGLLNSSIGISSAYAPMIDAGLQIATPDAASNNQFKLFNADSANRTNQFNAANTLNAGVANSGNLKDIALNTANLNNKYAIENLDANTKLKIANINALSNDSQLASSMNQSLMNAIVEINKQDKPVDVRQAEIQQLVNLTSKSIGLLNSFDTNIPTLDFSDITGVNLAGNKQADVTGGGTNQPSGSGSTVVSNVSLLNPLGYTVEPDTQKKVLNFQSATGYTVDPAKVVPQRLVDDLQSIADPTQNITNTYQNLKAYDWKKMMADTGSQSAAELVSKLFTPVYMPSPMNIPGKPTLAFYMYK